MNVLLAAINAKYIHSNLAVYSLRAYANTKGHDVQIAEYTINQRTDYILEQIYRKKPDVLAFSCYIWNIDYVLEVAEEFHKLCPEVPIWAGGPEVSFETEQFLTEYPFFTGLMMGEGERSFEAVCDAYEVCHLELTHGSGQERRGVLQSGPAENIEELLEHIDGITYWKRNGDIAVRPLKNLLPMDEIPFAYSDMSDFANRIVYYESSRGCPFNCSYCLSSVDKTLRFRSLPLVFQELQFFLDHRVPQVKFVDRTFNCRHDHAFAVWKYIKEHDNGITNFHFEVSADLLNREELELISDMRPGLIQLEIGVQSTHEKTIHEIHRTMRLPEVKAAVAYVKRGRNIHQHLDLIAGLPFEDYETFRKSFDDIYAWKPDQLQLGFLKVLKGSYMYEHAEEYGIMYRTKAPYEVLSTKWLSYDEVLEIRLVEEMLEIHYNSGQFLTALSVLEKQYKSAFLMFLDMGRFYRKKGYLDCNHSRVRRTEIFLEFAVSVGAKREEFFREALLFDLYKIEKSKSRPKWAPDLSADHRRISQYLRTQGMEKKYCHMEPFAFLHLEGDEISIGQSREDVWILFDYETRNPLTNAAELTTVVL